MALLLGVVPTRLFLTHRCISISWSSGTGSLWLPSVISRNSSARPPYCFVCWCWKTPMSINRNFSLFFCNQNITFGVRLHLLKGSSLNVQCRVLSWLSMIRIALWVADLWKEVTESNSRSKLFGLWRQQLVNQSHCFPSDTVESYRMTEIPPPCAYVELCSEGTCPFFVTGWQVENWDLQPENKHEIWERRWQHLQSSATHSSTV